MTDKEIIKAFRKKMIEKQKSKVTRPRFTLYRELLLLGIGIAVLIATLIVRSSLSKLQFWILFCSEILLFLVTETKGIILLLIYVYQKFAPAMIRGACLFTPSCSEYMRLSVLKYGAFKGVRKGLIRLRKCHPPNGGIDEP